MYRRIAVVVPSIRPESFAEFKKAWKPQLEEYGADLILVKDGKEPEIKAMGSINRVFSLEQVMGEDSDLIYNFNDGVRNLGFAFVAKKMPEVEVVISFDDDVRPRGDTIGDHLRALEQKVPTSWMSTTMGGDYMRGFPYGIRSESEVVLSHGTWYGVPDLDASTQLVRGVYQPEFYKGPIPRGVLYPMCIMNVAFKRKLLPYFYQAPMGPRVGLDRFADIWAGINSKSYIDDHNLAVVSGYATVLHERASNPFTNLVKEARGVGFNEEYWRMAVGYSIDPYFDLYATSRERWRLIMEDLV